MLLIIGRTLKEAMQGFRRNLSLNVAAIVILSLSLTMLGVIFLVSKTADQAMTSLKDRINVSVYFKSDVAEDQIMAARKDLESFSEIQSVNYISRDQALENFKLANANEPVIIQSLEEIGDNPLLASLVVKANDPSKYESITGYIAEAPFKYDVSRVNYSRHREAIDKISQIIAGTKKVDAIIFIVFGAIALLIIMSTIRLTIYARRQEVEIQRLVGASNTYIRLPFIFEGTIYGILAASISILMLFILVNLPRTPFLSMNAIPQILPGDSLSEIFKTNFSTLFGAQLLVGIILGIASSMLAIRKYLKF